MEQDQNFDASLTAFSAPVAPAAADPATVSPVSTHAESPAYPESSAYSGAYDDADVDWDPPKVRDSVVWGFRAFAAFAALVFLMFLGQLLSDDGESSNPTPSVSVPADADGAPASGNGSAGNGSSGGSSTGDGGGGLSDDGF